MKDYFFSGNQYIRVTRGDTGPGVVDAGYPRTISPNWGWGSFGANGIDAALYSGSKCYFFAGGEYIRATRGVTGPGTIDPGYPARLHPTGVGVRSVPMVSMPRCIATRSAISFQASNTFV